MTCSFRYTDEKNAQLMIALLKKYGITDVVISPGATNDRFVLGVQGDPAFRLYSAVDERHAGYLACGISQATGRPVVLNCTGATASRNYMSPLTEAYYRKLKILALTCSQPASRIGNLHPQVTDRIHLPADVVNLSVQCPVPKSDEDVWDCNLKMNRALQALTRHGGGPVHVNLETGYSGQYTAQELPDARKIQRVMLSGDVAWPTISQRDKIVVWIGSHGVWSEGGRRALEGFVKAYDAIVLTDLTSNYQGCGAIRSALLLGQNGARYNPEFAELKPDLIIHLGEISGDYSTANWLRGMAPVWRVSEDGELRDLFQRLEAVFEMPEADFFVHYSELSDCAASHTYRDAWTKALLTVVEKIPELPFSNLWIANRLSPRLPETATLHLGILNPLRCWNMTQVKIDRAFAMVGGFGIDGGVSAMLGSALAEPGRLHFGVFGDLSFFYDLNALGNRHLGKNMRILLVNNGEGGEFSVPGNIADNPACGERVHEFISARGHFAAQSRKLVRHFAEDLGLEYLTASSKSDFEKTVLRFTDPAMDVSMVFECFTNVKDDRSALGACADIRTCRSPSHLRTVASAVLPESVKNTIKKWVG